MIKRWWNSFLSLFKTEVKSIGQKIKDAEVKIESIGTYELKEIEDNWNKLKNKMTEEEIIPVDGTPTPTVEPIITPIVEANSTLPEPTKLEQVLSDVEEHSKTLYFDVLSDLSIIAKKLNPTAYDSLGVGPKPASIIETGIIGSISSAVKDASNVVEDIKKVSSFIKLYI